MKPVCPMCGKPVLKSKQHGHWIIWPKPQARHTKGMCPSD